jgi:metallophosphoesterase (TIGR00282 family)
VPVEAHDEPLMLIATGSRADPRGAGFLKLLFLGDVVGRSGRAIVCDRLPGLIARHSFDFVVVNGENAAGGFGITEEIFQALLDAGADCVTTGNHVWDQREALVFADRHDRFLRPVNYPPGTPGRGANVFAARNGARVLVVNVMGAVFMPSLDDPFAAVERSLSACPLGAGCDAAVVDMHAEATSEKQLMGHFLDGRASLVIGTHTHVPTADHRVLPGGTAFMSDVGMCGDYDSVIGMDKDEPLRRATTKIPSARFTPALGPGALSGLAVDIDDSTGLAQRVSPVRLGAGLAPAEPDFGVVA